MSKALETINARAAHVHEILSAPVISPAARIELLTMLSRAVAYHTSGKIEGLFSLDVACKNCEFCMKMQASQDPSVICTLCYTQSMYETAKAAHAITGEILSKLELTDDEAAAVAIPAGLFRFNSDGELINLTHALNLLRIAATHKMTSFAIWTKRPAILDAAVKKYGKPDNLIVGVSSPFINTPFSGNWTWCDFIFTVYTPGRIAAAIAAGSRECNGKKCLACGFKCYKERRTEAGPVHVAEVLRKPRSMKENEFSDLCARIDAATGGRDYTPETPANVAYMDNDPARLIIRK